jgi:hypothetical protein
VEAELSFVATVCPDGTPNLSPKGTTAVWDDDHVFAGVDQLVCSGVASTDPYAARIRWEDTMFAVVGRVRIKPGQEDLTHAMIGEHGVPMLHDMAGSAGGYWARAREGNELVQHSFWLFDNEDNARVAEATFNQLRLMPDAPAVFVSVDVCEVVGQA